MISYRRLTTVPPALADIHKEGFDPGWTTSTFEDFMSRPAVRLYAAFDDDRLISFLLISCVSSQCEILTFATAESARRRGVGRALFAHMLEDVSGEGVSEVFLEVATDNDAARALYAHLGFTKVGLRKAYYARRHGYPVDALVLSLTLEAS